MQVAAPDAPWVGATAASERPDPYVVCTRFLAQAAVVVAGTELKLRYGAFAALPVAVLLAPLWITAVRRYVLAPTIVVLGLAAVPAGWFLGELAESDHAISQALRQRSVALLLSGLAVFVLLLWARTIVPTSRVVVLYGAGALAGVLLRGQTDWKFNLALPVTLVVLGLIESGGHRKLAAVAVVVLGTITAVNGGRSLFGLCVLAAVITAWQFLSPTPKRTPGFAVLMAVAGLVLVVYLLASTLLTSGALGADAEARSREQISRSGSLISGGRPEWAVTAELFRLRPEGFGAGVIANGEDVAAGKAGLLRIGVDLDEGRKRYMFGSEFRLHSILADLWVRYGWFGVALGVALLAAVARSVNRLVGSRTADTSAMLLAVLAGWYLFFGPIYSNWADVCAGAAIVAVEAMRRSSADRGQLPA